MAYVLFSYYKYKIYGVLFRNESYFSWVWGGVACYNNAALQGVVLDTPLAPSSQSLFYFRKS